MRKFNMGKNSVSWTFVSKLKVSFGKFKKYDNIACGVVCMNLFSTISYFIAFRAKLIFFPLIAIKYKFYRIINLFKSTPTALNQTFNTFLISSTWNILHSFDIKSKDFNI